MQLTLKVAQFICSVSAVEFFTAVSLSIVSRPVRFVLLCEPLNLCRALGTPKPNIGSIGRAGHFLTGFAPQILKRSSWVLFSLLKMSWGCLKHPLHPGEMSLLAGILSAMPRPLLILFANPVLVQRGWAVSTGDKWIYGLCFLCLAREKSSSRGNTSSGQVLPPSMRKTLGFVCSVACWCWSGSALSGFFLRESGIVLPAASKPRFLMISFPHSFICKIFGFMQD